MRLKNLTIQQRVNTGHNLLKNEVNTVGSPNKGWALKCLSRVRGNSHARFFTEPQQGAHQTDFLTKVYYPYHPRSCETIHVVGRRSHRGERCLLAAVQEGKRELVPEWMTKPGSGTIHIVTTPSLQVSSLRQLRSLLNHTILLLPDKIKSKARRKNEIASTTTLLGKGPISHRNTEGESKTIR